MAKIPLPSMSFRGVIDYVALAAGVAIGFAVWQPVLSGLEDSLKKGGQ